jgi:hypothetical protein
MNMRKSKGINMKRRINTMNDRNLDSLDTTSELNQKFVNDIKSIIVTAQQSAVRSVDFCRVQMYWNMGYRIVEEEQGGKERADYGAYLIKNLAKMIEPEYGSGFSVRPAGTFCRQFYNSLIQLRPHCGHN